MNGLIEMLFVFLPQGVLYLGPETIMPLASILAAVLGFVLLFWRNIVAFFKKIFNKRAAPGEEVAPYVEPEDEDIRPS